MSDTRTPRPRARKSVAKKTATTKNVATATKKAAAPKARRPRWPKMVQLAIAAAQDKLARDLVVLDLRRSDAFTDFFVIATGANPRQVQAIADAIEHDLKQAGMRPSAIEGQAKADWILLDYFDMVVHVFSPAARGFYGLERLWATAVTHAVPDPERAAAADQDLEDIEAGE